MRQLRPVSADSPLSPTSQSASPKGAIVIKPDPMPGLGIKTPEPPASNLAMLNMTGVRADPIAPWAPDQYVTLGNSSRGTWDGKGWIAWDASQPAPRRATAQTSGTTTPSYPNK